MLPITPPSGAPESDSSPELLKELTTRRDVAQARVVACNELMKQLIDQSRSLLDTLVMWDSSRKQLDLHSQAALR